MYTGSGGQIWTLREKDKKRNTSMEMKVFRRTDGKTVFDHKRSEEILEELKIEPVDEKLGRYKPNRLRHVTRMDTNMMPEIMLSYISNGPRRLGRPLNRLWSITA
jgi:hypothetical protein